MPYVAVIGAGECSADLYEEARRAGRALAEAGAVVVTGGRGGVMEAACRGAKEGGGTTLGLLPGLDRSQANEWVDHALPTGLAEGRNLLVVRAADALVAIGGAWGTLTEIAFARQAGKPVFGVGTWELGDDGVVRAADGADAAARALAAAGSAG